MKKTIIFGTAFATILFAMASCGGSEEETTDETNDANNETEEVVIEAVDYSVDAGASVINWYVMEEGEKMHFGTAKVQEGSYTIEGDAITAATLTMDMSTVSADDPMGEKLLGHLNSPDFLNVGEYTISTFTFDRNEGGMIYGTLTVAGFDMNVEAGVTVTDGNVAISDFDIDMVQFPFFVTERAEAEEGDWHNPMIGFNADIIGQ
jgi:YceI-like domain